MNDLFMYFELIIKKQEFTVSKEHYTLPNNMVDYPSLIILPSMKVFGSTTKEELRSKSKCTHSEQAWILNKKFTSNDWQYIHNHKNMNHSSANLKIKLKKCQLPHYRELWQFLRPDSQQFLLLLWDLCCQYFPHFHDFVYFYHYCQILSHLDLI